MKIIYSILLLLCVRANATIYYVANDGNDVSNGTSIKTAWKTITKVNSSNFIPGDQILFKKGDIWNEKLNPPSSGAAGKVITFGSYGIGEKPLITGLQVQSGFTNIGNIWTTTAVNSVANLNTVLINGSLKAKARYPNTGYLTFTSYKGKNQITGSLSGSPDYTGAEVVVRSTHWIVDVSKIASQTGGTLNLLTDLSYTPNLGGNGYFIQNSPLALDLPGEWTFDSTTKTLKIFSSVSPHVQVSTIDTLIYINGKNFITVDGLSLQGANTAAIQLRSTRNIIIQNCTINNSGGLAIGGVFSNHASILKDSIQNSLSNAIYFVTFDFTKVGCDNVVIDNNYFKNSGALVGMGQGQYTKYCGIFISGSNSTITNNRLDSTGFIPIEFIGPNSVVKNNYISNFCFVKDDGGGIYTVIGKSYPASYNEGSVIRSNIIFNGIGAPLGTVKGDSPAPGIYLDDESRQITVDSNTVSNCNSAAVYFNRVDSVIFRENTLLNDNGHGLAIFGTNEFGNHLNVKRNVMFLLNGDHANIFRSGGTSNGAALDSNFYAKVITKSTFLTLKGMDTVQNTSTLNKTTPQEKHSVSIPLDPALPKPEIYFNARKKSIIIKLKGTYFDARGKKYKNSIKIEPFMSAILFKSS